MNFVKSISIALTLAAASSTVWAASAPTMPQNNDNSWYVGARGALNIPTSSYFNPGYGANIEAGRWFNRFALEGEVGYLNNGVRGDSSGNYESKTFGMVNGYFGFKNHTAFTPYLGAGIGVATVYAEATYHDAYYDFDIHESITSLAYQGIAGLSYQINNHWSAGVDYRYFNTAQSIKHTPHFGSNLVTLGVDYHF